MTPVIFRKFKNDNSIIALFPTLLGTNEVNTCLSYQHIGQHGSASIDLIQDTLPCKWSEVKELALELKNIGYDDLKMYARWQKSFDKERQARLNIYNKLGK